ncbi:MAG: flagellar basal body P-ring protein FlgI [Planctomycetaceae bacterium]
MSSDFPSSESNRLHHSITIVLRSRMMATTCLLLATLLCGCAGGLMSMPGAAALSDRFSRDKKKDEAETKSSRRKKEEDNDFGNKVETPLLSEYMSVQGNSLVVLRGVGLVTGLNGDGGDPSPSTLRTQLQNEMLRRGVKDAKKILASRDTALVVVTAYLPAMVHKGQKFDVRVALPPNSNARSLKGGWLLETRLFEEQNFDGRSSLRAQEYAVAGGAILTGLGVRDKEERQAELMNGSIPGGAISKVDRDLRIVLRSDKKGTRNSQRIANAVSERFHRYNKYGQRVACAEAKDDTLVLLKTHEQYVNNFPRYQAVIRNLALNESDVARRMRMEVLARDILEPEKCQLAALQLEAIGSDSIPFLKDALESENFEVRFMAAQSLAYLEDPSGVPVLLEAARDQPAFRIYAMVALSVVRNDADAVLALRELMNTDSLETRYGAFRALKELDPNDPALNPISFKNRFTLHVIESSGEPMVHVTRRRAPEIVVFGEKQGFNLPLVLNAGRNIRVKGEEGSSTLEVTFYQLNAEPQRQRIPNNIVQVLATCGELGATYPDVVQLLVEADQQRNFTGEFGIDRLPQAGRLYVKDSDELAAATEEDSKDDKGSRQIGNAKMLPEMFDELDEEELKENESAEKLLKLDFQEVNKRDEKEAKLKGRVIDELPEGDAKNSEKSETPQAPDESGVRLDSDDSDSESSEDSSNNDEASMQSSESKSESGMDSLTETEDSVENDEPADETKPASNRWGWWDRIRRPFGGLSEPEPATEP